MNAAPQIKGWCPGALRPMMSGDGLVVRVRPFGGRLRRAQADGLATLAAVHGNGMIDLSSRGNIQLRGVTEDSHTPLIEGLRAMGLVDAKADVEGRRNILVQPFWQPGEETTLLADKLADALAADDAPKIPSKFGFVIDTGHTPVLQDASGDVRIERDVDGGLIIVADGAERGKRVTSETAITEAMALAHWFIVQRGDQTRMAALLSDTKSLSGYKVPRQKQSFVPTPGHTPQGALCALALGQMQSETLATLAKHGGLRMTPWRMLLVESARMLPEIDGVITDPADPMLRVLACTGAPHCSQGLAETKALTRHLAPHVPQGSQMHVSGCAKGCAHPRIAPLTVTAVRGGFSLTHNSTAAQADPNATLTPDDIIQQLKAI